MDRRTFLRLMASTSGLLLSNHPLLQGCSGKHALLKAKSRLVMLYASCSVNKFCLSPYNSNVRYTPAIGRFASEGAVLAKHQTESGQSGVAYASIVSGSQADKHGIYNHPRKIDDSLYLITEAFAQNDYDAHHWDGHPMASYDMGYGQGVRQECHYNTGLNADDPGFEKILTRLSSDKEYRAFILTSYSLTHHLYTKSLTDKYHNYRTLPDEFREMGISKKELRRYRRFYFSLPRSFPLSWNFEGKTHEWGLSEKEVVKFIKVVEYLYKCGIHYLDTTFGRIIGKITEYGLLDESVIIFTADHGEVLYRDNVFAKFTHGFQLAPEVLSVPLIIRAPALGVNAMKHSFVSRSIDVFPTAAGLCGLKIPEENKADGIDLSSVLTGQRSQPSLPAFSHTALVNEEVTTWDYYKGSPYYKLYPRIDPDLMWVAVRIEDMYFKWARFDLDHDDFAPFAFNLADDPQEKHNLFDHNNKRHREILDQLRQYKKMLAAAYRVKYENTESGISEEERTKKLRSLGYIK